MTGVEWIIGIIEAREGKVELDSSEKPWKIRNPVSLFSDSDHVTL